MAKKPLFRISISTLAVAGALLIAFKGLPVKKSTPLATPGEGTMVRAPEFPANADWLNTDKPLTLRALKGKIVLLDFWTYCCINCMHILPDLKKLERKYPNELVVVGVHSAKFENEGDTANIRNAIMRYKIEHPVLNDKDMKVWDEYTVRGWPTQVLIDPNGRIVKQLSGEGNYEEFDAAIAKLVKEFKARGELREESLQWSLEAAKTRATPLSFPGKVLADADGKRLFVADSNHNRIVISDLEGNVQAVAGSGAGGLEDGAFTAATFNNPQGMCLSEDGNTLYVADTDNHALRALDLQKKTVVTIAGNGNQGSRRTKAGPGVKTPLSSPWDVVRVGNSLYVAMAGSHQVWSMDLGTGIIGNYAGSGNEARYDADLAGSALAQPSGLAVYGGQLYFADSESSSIRSMTLPGGDGVVKTWVGGDPNPTNLFAFGDRGGKGFDARLQHPLGVAYNDEFRDLVFVADTYNHKIKQLNLVSVAGFIEDLAGQGRGLHDGALADAMFNEPGGLSVALGKLYVADTNNHLIRVIDIKAHKVSTLEFKNLPAALPSEPERQVKPVGVPANEGGLVLDSQILALDKPGELLFEVDLPKGFHLNKEAPQKWQARIEGTGLTLAKTTVTSPQFKLPLRVGYNTAANGSGVVVITASVYYCTDDMGLCKVQQVKVRAPFKIQTGGAAKLNISTAIGSDDRVTIRGY